MKIIVSAILAFFIPVTASVALAQPRPPGPPPGPPPGLPHPFRPGLPPPPKLPPPAFPPGPRLLPFDPLPFQRGPVRWLPFDPPPYERIPVLPPLARVPNLDGIWYMNGDPGKPTRIVQWRLDGRAMFINEQGSRAWGTIGGGSVAIPDWTDGFQEGLIGVLRGDRIVWPDRNYWSRLPNE